MEGDHKFAGRPGRGKSAQHQLPHGSIQSLESGQLELFSPAAIEQAGKPVTIAIRDPHRPDYTRTMIVASHAMRSLLGILEQVAPTNETVLLLGESGTGKNWLAWLLHSMSGRRKHPFIELNVGQHPEGLVDSAIFGHEKGAFTGAHEMHPGSLALAEGGTLFVNEAGDLSPASQLKLLRFLDDRVYERVGGTAVQVADVRVIAATHRDLPALVKEGRFREDLYYRLNVVSVRVPPLRERRDEIAPIAEAMLKDIARDSGKPWLMWTSDALDLVSQRPWHGNLRALRNFIVSAAILAKGNTLGPEEVDRPLSLKFTQQPIPPDSHAADDRRSRYIQAYQSTRGNRSAMARLLKTCRVEVRRKIREYGLETPGSQ